MACAFLRIAATCDAFCQAPYLPHRLYTIAVNGFCLCHICFHCVLRFHNCCCERKNSTGFRGCGRLRIPLHTNLIMAREKLSKRKMYKNVILAKENGFCGTTFKVLKCAFCSKTITHHYLLHRKPAVNTYYLSVMYAAFLRLQNNAGLRHHEPNPYALTEFARKRLNIGFTVASIHISIYNARSNAVNGCSDRGLLPSPTPL